jgi:hypothetical protein
MGQLGLTGVRGGAASILAGGLTGGISSKLAGGTFVDGMKNGLITAGLNHALHKAADGLMGGPERQRGLIGYQGKTPDGKDLYGVDAISIQRTGIRETVTTFHVTMDESGRYIGFQQWTEQAEYITQGGEVGSSRNILSTNSQDIGSDQFFAAVETMGPGWGNAINGYQTAIYTPGNANYFTSMAQAYNASNYRFGVSSLIGGGGLGAAIGLGITGASGGTALGIGAFLGGLSAAAPNSWYGGKMAIIHPFQRY